MDDEKAQAGAVLAALRERAAAAGGGLSFAEFMETVLYHPGAGYYARPGDRVGKGGETDFYTAASPGLAPVFRELVVGAVVGLLGGAGEAGGYTFVEVGAEPGRSLLGDGDGGEHPFAGARTFRLGNPLEVPPRAVVFANELLDAQPFHRLVYRGGRWRELGVAVAPDGDGWDAEGAGAVLEEVFLSDLSPPVAAVAGGLPAAAPEGYRIDLPLGAEALLGRLARAGWEGLFLTFDYGLDWATLTAERPEGTARAYYRHRQERDLLARPGAQDLTCHLCWDRLAAVLGDAGFGPPRTERQEAFFVNRARGAIEALMARPGGSLDPDRRALQALLHPGHLGQRFQAFWARRPAGD